MFTVRFRAIFSFSVLFFLAGVAAAADAGGGGPATSMAALDASTSLKLPGDPDPNASAGNATESGPSISVANAANYTLSTVTTASLANMSSGTTTLIAADQDDTASPVTPIGFDFYFQGVRQDRFSVNSNGTLRFGATARRYDPL